ncbi:MAG: hypothetical protein Q8N84_02365 [bacterium]|nr:hypothetical protein [bacterium]
MNANLSLWAWAVLIAQTAALLMVSVLIRRRYITREIKPRQLILLGLAFLLASFYTSRGNLVIFLAIVVLDRVISYLLRWGLKKESLVREANQHRFWKTLQKAASQFYLLERAVDEEKPLVDPREINCPWVDGRLMFREVTNLAAQTGIFLLFRLVWLNP